MLLNGAPLLNLAALPPSPTRTAKLQIQATPTESQEVSQHEPRIDSATHNGTENPFVSTVVPRPFDTPAQAGDKDSSELHEQFPRLDLASIPATPRFNNNQHLIHGLSPLTPVPPTPAFTQTNRSKPTQKGKSALGTPLDFLAEKDEEAEEEDATPVGFDDF